MTVMGRYGVADEAATVGLGDGLGHGPDRSWPVIMGDAEAREMHRQPLSVLIFGDAH